MTGFKLIVFDGVCVLCTRWLRFVLKHDRKAAFRFASMQSPAGRYLLARHGLDADDPVSLLLLVDGRSYRDTDAVLRVLAELGGVWRAFRVFHLVPRLLRDPVYRFVARHRYRWFGKRDTCVVPDADVAARFVHEATELPDVAGHP